MLIGISGVARSGKDTLGRFLVEKLPGRTLCLALAKKLKDETAPIIHSNFGLDVWSSDTEQKKIFRDFLVAWGLMRRKQTQGQYFINHAKLAMEKLADFYDHFVITDVRYAEYENDEMDWIKQNGVLVHIRRTYKDGLTQPPANKHEEENDLKLMTNADFTINNIDNDFDTLNLSVDRFIQFLYDKGKLFHCQVETIENAK